MNSPYFVYTDGSCINNGAKDASGGIGVVVQYPSGKLMGEYVSPMKGKATNNRAELAAVYKGLTKVPDGNTVVVNSDSQYAINVLDKTWTAQENLDIINAINKEKERLGQIRFHKVKAHSDNRWNNRADTLALKAAKMAASAARKGEEA